MQTLRVHGLGLMDQHGHMKIGGQEEVVNQLVGQFKTVLSSGKMILFYIFVGYFPTKLFKGYIKAF